ncbi:MAG: type II toxin-antitoxin system VapC family toxin [Desulfocapsaceae bacterium]
MKYLLDTCVISELRKKNPDVHVVSWIQGRSEPDLYISVLTIGEMVKGVEKLPESKNKKALLIWLNEDLRLRFENRIIDLDVNILTTWGRIQAASEKIGQPMPAIDSLIAATAITYTLTVVTRNIKDMQISGASLFDPWKS